MNKQEVIKAIATATKLTQVDVSKVLGELESLTHTELQKPNGRIQLTGYVTIQAVARAARKGFDPIKKVAMDIEPTVGVRVSAGEKLKKAVDGLKYEDVLKAKA